MTCPQPTWPITLALPCHSAPASQEDVLQVLRPTDTSCLAPPHMPSLLENLLCLAVSCLPFRPRWDLTALEQPSFLLILSAGRGATHISAPSPSHSCSFLYHTQHNLQCDPDLCITCPSYKSKIPLGAGPMSPSFLISILQDSQF